MSSNRLFNPARVPPSWSWLRASYGLASALAALALSGCDQSKMATTPGQRLDAALANGERQVNGLKAEARTAGERASEGASALSSKVEAFAGDAGTTARVKTRLAADAAINALKINVDSRGTHVTLTGTVSSMAARERAIALAKSVDGVQTVENKLVVIAASNAR